MLKFLTHKLRTHSLNEDNNYLDKGDEDHDSGTESDEEVEAPSEIVMSEELSCEQSLSSIELVAEEAASVRAVSVSPADTGCSGGSSPHEMELHDPHSSEEELEVINNTNNTDQTEKTPSPAVLRHHQSTKQHQRRASASVTAGVTSVTSGPGERAASVCLPEKRKWSQVCQSAGAVAPEDCSPENEENMSQFGNLSPSRICRSPSYGKLMFGGAVTPLGGLISSALNNGGELGSDDEVHQLLHAPVQFRTSPPLEALKPGPRPPKLIQVSGSGDSVGVGITTGSTTVAPSTVEAVLGGGGVADLRLQSPRKRSRHHAHHTHHHHVHQRPCLDFEKMQQLKARAVTAWRHSGDHSGELSVFCW